MLCRVFKKIGIVCFSFFLGLAYAGQSCQNKVNPAVYQIAAKQAVSLNRTLNATQSNVVLVARVGGDLSKYGVNFTHVGFAVKNFKHRKGWTVIHLLNQCGTAYSDIHAQGLMNFFLDDLFKMDYQVITLSPDLQNALYKNLNSSLVNKIHEQRYNMLAYPFSVKYQNSNQWILEMIEASKHQLTDRAKTQMALNRDGYIPYMIRVQGFSRIGASLFKNNVKFDDHPVEEQRKNQFSTITVDSIIQFLKRQHQVVSVKVYA